MTTGGVLTTPAAEVDAARQELREAVDDLTTITHHKLELDDGTIRHATTPPLLVQVADEIAGNSQNQGGNSWRSKPPLWFDGAALLRDVDDETERHDGDDRCARVRTWCNAMASGTPGSVLDAAHLANRWHKGCHALLTPTPKWRVRGQACPNCGLTKVWEREDRDNDENHARPALEIDTDRGVCVCLACDETWTPEWWPHLRAVLEQQQAETLAAEPHSEPVVDIKERADAAGVPVTPCVRDRDQL